MSRSSCPHLFLLAIASIILLLFTIVNCNNNNNDNQMERTLFEKKLITNDNLNDLLKQESFNDGNVNVFIRDLLSPYSDRRLSFYAMRGKRRAILQ